MDMQQELIAVLDEVDEFLTILAKVSLPPMVERLRRKLFKRVFDTLSRAEKVPSSPDPYIDMTCGQKRAINTKISCPVTSKATSLNTKIAINAITSRNSEPDEYIEPIKSPSFLHDRHVKEHHENMSQELNNLSERSQPSAIKLHPPHIRNKRNETVKPLNTDNGQVSARSAESEAFISGPLQRRERKYLIDRCFNIWAALIGSRMLIYDGQDAMKPREIISIKECVARRPSGFRNLKRDDLTFELLFADKKILQFAADTPTLTSKWLEGIQHYSKASSSLIKEQPIDKSPTKTCEGVDNHTDNSEDIKTLMNLDRSTTPAGFTGETSKKHLEQRAQLFHSPNSTSTYPIDTEEEYHDVGDFHNLDDSFRSSTENSTATDHRPLIDMYQDLDDMTELNDSTTSEISIKLDVQDDTMNDGFKHSEFNNYKSFPKSVRKLPLPPLPVQRETEDIYNHIEDVDEKSEAICDETYDDVGITQSSDQQLPQELPKIINEQETKKAPELPKRPVKTLMLKLLPDIKKNINESLQRNTQKTKLEQLLENGNAAGMVEMSLHRKNPVVIENSPTQEEYINPPPPRPVHNNACSGFGTDHDVTDVIYDDISSSHSTSINPVLVECSTNKSDVQKEVEISTPVAHQQIASSRTLQKSEAKPKASSCVKKSDFYQNFISHTDKTFYQNLLSNTNTENYTQHYQIPKTTKELNSIPRRSLEYTDETYDEVGSLAPKESTNDLSPKKGGISSNNRNDSTLKLTPEKKPWNIFGIRTRSSRK